MKRARERGAGEQNGDDGVHEASLSSLFRPGELDALFAKKGLTVKTDDELIALAKGVGLNPSPFGVLTRASHIVTAQVD